MRTGSLTRQLTVTCLSFFGIFVTSGAANPAPQKSQLNNGPNATMRSVDQARSLAMLWQVVMQLERHVRSKELSAIHDEDVILSSAARELLAQAAIGANRSGDFKVNLTELCSRVSAMHIA